MEEEKNATTTTTTTTTTTNTSEQRDNAWNATTTTTTNTAEQRDNLQLLASNDNNDHWFLANVQKISGHVLRAITLQDPLSIHHADLNQPIIDEDVLLVEPDYRWKDYEIEGVEDTVDPEYVKETSGKCACFCKVCCCLPPARNMCECPMDRHEKNPKWYSGFLKYPAFPALEFTFENQHS